MAPGPRLGHAAQMTWTSAVWRTDRFATELRAFVREAVGEPERIDLVQHRPWSAVWRVCAGGRASYAKQNCPGQAHEARLMQTLAAAAPEYVVPVLAADPDRDLLLTAGLGPTVREQGRAGDLGLWCRIMTDAATLQRRLVPDAGSLGLTVMAPDDATTYVADAAGRLAALPDRDPRRLDPVIAARLERLLPTIDRWSEEVDDLGLPLTLVHNDLHDANVVAVGGSVRFFDFGDAVVAEPLGNLLIPLDAARASLAAAPGDPRLRRLADAALEVWSDLAPMADLRAALPAALGLARLGRVESWRRCVATMTPAEQADFGAAPAGWLASLVDAGGSRGNGLL